MNRLRMRLLVGIGVLCLLAGGLYFVTAVRAANQPESPTAVPMATVAAAGLLERPHVVFRNTVLGPDYSKLAVVALADPGGPRGIEPTSCERVYATVRAGVCVTAKRGVAPTYALATLGSNLQQTSSTQLVGLPSRARMSVDGSLVATTTFVTGHSYAQTSFSTETIIRRNGTSLGSLESWPTRLPKGALLAQVNRNYWGATFAADDDHFFVTAASGNTTWLARGSVADHSMEALRTNAECPSLSPDGTKVAYKKRVGTQGTGLWQLAVLDLATNTEVLLDGTRGLDDQAEWLDASQLLYGLPRSGSEATTSDIWAVAANGSASPKLLIPNGTSPAVVRS
jgi:hypothetical protein